MSEVPDAVALALSGRKYITTNQRKALAKEYRQCSRRSRRAMVLAFHQTGMADDRLADLLGVEVGRIISEREEALAEIEGELDALPEGPMLMSHIVVEGYARMNTTIIGYAQTALETLTEQIQSGDADPKLHTAIQGYMRVMIEARDALTDRMERYGQLPLVSKTMMGQRGGKDREEIPFEDQLKKIAKKNGIDIDELRDRMIEDAVQ